MKKTFILFLLIPFFSFSQFLPPDTTWYGAIFPDTLEEPDYLDTIYDTNYNMDYIKISDSTVFSDSVNFSLSGGSIQHQYAKTQAWNADETLIHLGTVFFLNADDYTIHKTLFSASLIDSRWANTEADYMYYGQGEYYMKINVRTEDRDTLHHFPGYQYATTGPWEGNLSKDDKYVVITSYDAHKASVYDIENDTILGTKEFFGVGFDWASVTPSGEYIAVANNETDHLELYDLNFNYLRDLTDETQHGDFAIDVNGDEVFVQVIELSMIRLSDGLITDLLPAGNHTICGYSNYEANIGGHVSGRNFDLPGWAFVSTGKNECNLPQLAGTYYYNGEIFAIKLDGSGTIKHFGYSRSSNSSYGSSVRATVNHDGTKVIFASDWNMYNNNGAKAVSYIGEFRDTISEPIDTVIIPNDTIIDPVDSTTIITSISSKQLFYPNPVSNYLTIKLAGKSDYKIYNYLGKIMITESYHTGKESIDVSKYPKGVYYLKVNSNNQIFKFVKIP